MGKIRYFVVAAPAVFVFTGCYSMCIDEHGDRVSEKNIQKEVTSKKTLSEKEQYLQGIKQKIWDNYGIRSSDKDRLIWRINRILRDINPDISVNDCEF